MRIGCDLVVIEREIQFAPVGAEFGACGIVAGCRRLRIDSDQIGDADGVPARIAIGPRIDADETQMLGAQAGFLGELPARGGLGWLAVRDETAGQGKLPRERRMASANEQETIMRVEYDTIHRDAREFMLHVESP